MATTSKLKDTYNYANPNTKNQNGIKLLDEYKNIVNTNTAALSNLNQANKQALKYANVASSAQGYSTQGAATQNISNLQNEYINKVNQQNQLAQQQIGALQNTDSTSAYSDYEAAITNAVSQGSLTQDELNKLQETYYNRMNSNDLANAETLTRQTIGIGNDVQQGSVNEITNKVEFTNENGIKYSSNINSKKGNRGRNITITIGSKDFEMELGNKLQDVNFDPSTIEIGQIQPYESDAGHIYLITKDSDGDIRYIKQRTGTTTYGIGGHEYLSKSTSHISGYNNAKKMEELGTALGF